MKKIMFLAIAMLFCVASFAQDFSAHFVEKTLRIDYIFAGNAEQQFVALNELSEFDGWAGRRVNLDRVPVRGNGEIKLIDPKTNKTIYRNTFSSLFQEWLVTDEAKELSKSFEATFLVPM
ncbi:MAG: peptidase M64, partial [Alistipes sp.]|nr:peptidase M64 [Alistipes sp.]